jgi:hypothetical protein
MNWVAEGWNDGWCGRVEVGCLIWSSCSVVGVVWMSCVSVAGGGG